MKKKKIVAWMLGLTMLLLFCAAAAESGLPEIPAFAGKLNVRPIATEEEAIEYAKEIWALDYLGMDFPISFYKVSQYEPNVWTVYAKDGPDDGDYCYGDVLFDLDGNVIRVENASSGFCIFSYTYDLSGFRETSSLGCIAVSLSQEITNRLKQQIRKYRTHFIVTHALS